MTRWMRQRLLENSGLYRRERCYDGEGVFMAYELSHAKTAFTGFESGHLPAVGSAIDGSSADNYCAPGIGLTLPNKTAPETAAKVMAHYADDVHPEPHSPGYTHGPPGHGPHRVGAAADAKHHPDFVHTGLGDKIDEIAAKSPTLEHNLATLQNNRWTIKYGEKGAGSFTNRTKSIITLDANKKRHILSLIASLAHESGHALYRPAAPVLMDEHVNRQQYIDRNLDRHLQDEGEATITNLQVRAELLKAKQGDIGVSGAKPKEYIGLYKKYPEAKDRDKLRAEIGKIFAQGEHPSTAPNMTYGEFYGKPFEAAWDRSHRGAPKP